MTSIAIRLPCRSGLLALLLVALVGEAGAAVTDHVVVERVASGLSRPVFVTAPDGDAERLFIVEQHTGRIRILRLDSDVVEPVPFLTVSGLATGDEQGLLGLAFHPDYASNGYFYVDFTDTSGTTNVVRYQVSADPDVADPGSASTVLTIGQPQSNHNGGWLGFGPDGFLYVSTGDGGGANDSGTGHTPETGNAQDITDNLLGKLLRIDVNGDDFPADPGRNYAIPATNPFVGVTGDDEIWAFGLRNPWRPSFDRLTGDLYIADVGQGAREEIDFQPASSPGGENYAWRLREGTIATPGVGGPPPPGAVEPIYDYPHGGGPYQGRSVTGGYVYRGPVPSLSGKYFFGDYVSEQVWSIEHDGTAVTELLDWTSALVPDAGTIDSISSFGEDAAGNLYIVDLGGEVFRLSPPCTLELDLAYGPGLTMSFVVGTTLPATWSAWLVVPGSIFPVWILPVPAFPDTGFDLPLPGFPPVGFIAALTWLGTDDGVICVALDAVTTGAP